MKKNIEDDFLDLINIPEHVAVIMDGNRRWAKKNNLTAFIGHQRGARTLTDIVKICLKLKIKTLTAFAFSTENWNRSQREIKNLMKLFDIYLKKKMRFMQKEGVRLDVIGDLGKCPKILQESFDNTMEGTKKGDKLNLVLAINYGSKDEIKRAVVKILEDYDKKILTKQNISEKLINSYLDTKNYKDPDLLIRTSGEQRLSNFLLWQMSYTEIYISKLLWPEFKKEDFLQAIMEFQKRKRRLGGT